MNLSIDNELRFQTQVATVIKTANNILEVIRRTFVYLDGDMLTRLFTKVSSILRHGNSVPSRTFTWDTDILEGVREEQLTAPRTLENWLTRIR